MLINHAVATMDERDSGHYRSRPPPKDEDYRAALSQNASLHSERAIETKCSIEQYKARDRMFLCPPLGSKIYAVNCGKDSHRLMVYGRIRSIGKAREIHSCPNPSQPGQSRR